MVTPSSNPNAAQTGSRVSVVPTRAYADDRLGKADVFVLGILVSIQSVVAKPRLDGWFSASQRQISLLADISRQTINMSVTRLRESGYIAVEKQRSRGGRQCDNVYRIIYDADLPGEHNRWANPDTGLDDHGIIPLAGDTPDLFEQPAPRPRPAPSDGAADRVGLSDSGQPSGAETVGNPPSHTESGYPTGGVALSDSANVDRVGLSDSDQAINRQNRQNSGDCDSVGLSDSVLSTYKDSRYNNNNPTDTSNRFDRSIDSRSENYSISNLQVGDVVTSPYGRVVIAMIDPARAVCQGLSAGGSAVPGDVLNPGSGQRIEIVDGSELDVAAAADAVARMFLDLRKVLFPNAGNPSSLAKLRTQAAGFLEDGSLTPSMMIEVLVERMEETAAGGGEAPTAISRYKINFREVATRRRIDAGFGVGTAIAGNPVRPVGEHEAWPSIAAAIKADSRLSDLHPWLHLVALVDLRAGVPVFQVATDLVQGIFGEAAQGVAEIARRELNLPHLSADDLVVEINTRIGS